MKLRFTLRAVENIAALADYIRERNPTASERVQCRRGDHHPQCQASGAMA
jgi:hypothetical protein